MIYLDLRLLADRFLLFTTFLLLLVNLVVEVDLHSKLFTEPVDANAMGTDHTSDILFLDLKLGNLVSLSTNGKLLTMSTYVAADDFIVFGVLDNLKDFFGGSIDIRSNSAHKDNILVVWNACIGTNLDRKGLVFPNDANWMNNN